MDIAFYIPFEGGPFMFWPKGPIDEAFLPECTALLSGCGGESRYIELDGISLHALVTGDGKVWDVINGWRDEAFWHHPDDMENIRRLIE